MFTVDLLSRKTSFISVILKSYFPNASPSSRVSGSFSPSVSGKRKLKKPATKANNPNIIVGKGSQNIF